MSTQRERQALWIFFVVAFGIPWPLWTIAFVLDRVSAPTARWFFFSGVACSVAGLLATVWANGLGGCASLLARAVRFAVSPRWWLFVLLAPLGWALASAFIWAALRGPIGPVAPSAVADFYLSRAVLLVLLLGPIGEEFGWRGFLLPRMLAGRSNLAAALVTGLIWAVWHAPLYYDRAVASATWAIAFIVGVMCFSVLIALVYLRTGSLLLAIVFHFTINSAQDVVGALFPALDLREPLFVLVSTVLLIAGTIAASPALNATSRDRIFPAADRDSCAAP